MPQWLVIGISGVTCGGKTTLAHNLRDYLQNSEGHQLWSGPYTLNDVQLVSQDDYFLAVDDPRQKWNERLNVVNYELITSLDMKQMLHDITWLMRGRKPHKDVLDNIDYINKMAMSTNFEHYAEHHHHQQHQQQHQQHSSHQHQHYQHKHQNARFPANRPYNVNYQQQQQQQLQQQQTIDQQQQHAGMRLAGDYKINILLLDGFLLYNQPELLVLCNMKFHLHIPYEKCFARRRLRTYDPPDVTGYFEICVWPHYEKNLAEYRQHKDIKFLNGDLPDGRLLKYVLQRIKRYVEKRNDGAVAVPQHQPPLPPPATHKFLAAQQCHGKIKNAAQPHTQTKSSSTMEHH